MGFLKSFAFVLAVLFLFSDGPPPKSPAVQEPEIGDKLDSLNGVYVYFNGDVTHVLERNVASDGYNIGLKYQCVEFVKRYYYEFLNHKMPNSYGHAKDFFDSALKDGEFSRGRGLYQFSNPGVSKPRVNDIVVFKAAKDLPYGHVAIVSKVDGGKIEIIQQNPNPGVGAREEFELTVANGKWRINHEGIAGWLSKEKSGF